MIQPETPQKKKGIGERVPRLGRVSQLMLIVGIFLVISIPLWIVSRQQPARQVELKATLGNLQKILSVEETPTTKLETELEQIEAETEAAKAAFPKASQGPEILDSLLELAELNDIYVTGTQVSTSPGTKTVGPVMSIALSLRGQVPNFQNFLLALDDRLPTSQISRVVFTIAGQEEEEDRASVTINVFCYGGSE